MSLQFVCLQSKQLEWVIILECGGLTPLWIWIERQKQIKSAVKPAHSK
jgi:hypothetical protein